MKTLEFSQRAKVAVSPVAQGLLRLMAEKKTNLSLSADLTDKRELLALADLIGPEIAILKTHIDIIRDFDVAFIDQLQQLAKKHNFMIFEDRKFADIGHTVQLQFTQGVYKIADWADMVNAHVLPGPGIIKGLKAGASSKNGLILLAQMSSKGNLLNTAYTKAAVTMAEQNRGFVFGFICQQRLSDDHGMLHLTPGVELSAKDDPLGQQYRTPEMAIAKQGCDIIIVGRGIIQASDPLAVATNYRSQAWLAYQSRLAS